MKELEEGDWEDGACCGRGDRMLGKLGLGIFLTA